MKAIKVAFEDDEITIEDAKEVNGDGMPYICIFNVDTNEMILG